jgi:hypothetical protein
MVEGQLSGELCGGGGLILECWWPGVWEFVPVADRSLVRVPVFDLTGVPSTCP